MAALDAVNARYGRGTLSTAVFGVERTWRAREALISSRYTTRLSEIVQVRGW